MQSNFQVLVLQGMRKKQAERSKQINIPGKSNLSEELREGKHVGHPNTRGETACKQAMESLTTC